ncbi:glycosyltransferase [Rhodococcus fascians]|nr:glycosyltransferase [Rhodococcus fascians]MBY4235568.1 glycosyltransferase [Rhodococcus fascians]MBY4251259.1 glycosyltransferase [Rhodococcus fascians]MBY4266914.1 glycosyltransferase [Rhodococcus fascians]
MSSKPYVFYLAVVPIYRKACIEYLLEQHGDEIAIFAGSQHLDPTVKTGLDTSLVHPVRNFGLLGNKILLQFGNVTTAIAAEVAVIDLNPRSITAWWIAIARTVLNRRTLAWGHLHPRSGPGSRTAALRVLMRRLVQGTILYGYDSVVPARKDLPQQPVWVAPNSLYAAESLNTQKARHPRSILYVGRLEPDKNTNQLIEAFTLSQLAKEGYKLEIVGFGSMADAIKEMIAANNTEASVHFHGRIDDVKELSAVYSRALFSVSPGYIGLSLTQSLGFGTPMLYSLDQPHSPEIELARFGYVKSYGPGTPEGLGRAMHQYAHELNDAPVDARSISREVSRYYSAETMADGLWDALSNANMNTTQDGWPNQGEPQ